MEILIRLYSIYRPCSVKKLKGMIIKIIEERGHLTEDVLTRAMIELRNTPGPCGISPATIVYGCEFRSLLPIIERRDAEDAKRKEYYDKCANTCHLGQGCFKFSSHCMTSPE